MLFKNYLGGNIFQPIPIYVVLNKIEAFVDYPLNVEQIK